MSDEMKPVKGVVIFTNGTYEERTFNSLNDLQIGVDGFICSVRLFNGKGEQYAQAYVDDEGWDTDINPTLLAFIKQIFPERKEQESELV